MMTTMRAGISVTIKDKATGDKVRGTVLTVDRETAMVDVTMGPSPWPGAPPMDHYRKFAPGRTAVTLTIAVDAAGFVIPAGTEVRVKDRATREKFHGTVAKATIQAGPMGEKLTMVVEIGA